MYWRAELFIDETSVYVHAIFKKCFGWNTCVCYQLNNTLWILCKMKLVLKVHIVLVCIRM